MNIEEKIEIVNSKLNNEIKKNIAVFARDEKDYVALRIYTILKRFYSVRMIFGKNNSYKFDYLDYSDSQKINAYLTLNSFDAAIVTTELFYSVDDVADTQILLDILNKKNIKLIFLNISSYYRIENDELKCYELCDSDELLKEQHDNIHWINVSTVVGNSDLAEDCDLIHALYKDIDVEKVIDAYDIEVCLSDDVANYIAGILNDDKNEHTINSYRTSIKELSAYVGSINENGICIGNGQNNVEDLIRTLFNQKSCVFKLIYMLSPKDYYYGSKVAKSRIDLGKRLADVIPSDVVEDIDIVVPVPKTGMYYAMGVAAKIEKPYIQALIKDTTDIRTFQIFDANIRKEIIRNKVIPIPELIRGKNILLIDEAIFTGTTLKEVCRMVRQCGAKAVYIAIPSPACYNQCKFGMQPERVMLLEYYRKNNLEAYFNVDGVYFQNSETFKEMINEEHVCMQCFVNEVD